MCQPGGRDLLIIFRSCRLLNIFNAITLLFLFLKKTKYRSVMSVYMREEC